MAKSLLLIATCVVLGVIGQLFLKSGMVQVGRITAASLSNPVQLMEKVIKTPIIPIGFLFYIVGSVLWLIVLSRENLSFAYPLIGSTYILIVLLSRVVFHETVTPLRWLGALVISAGVFLITRS
jgi:multidrug transporter EmrE-like cation transporter